MEGQTLNIYANGWGINREELLEISQLDWDTLRTFLQHVEEVEVQALNGRQIVWGTKKGDWMQADIHSRTSDIGGNTFNTAMAIDKVLGVTAPAMREKLRFHAPKSPELSNLPFPTELRETQEDLRMRVSYVIRGPNGEDARYWSVPPQPMETGPLPDEPNVFLSSAGPDVYAEILAYRRRNPEGRIFLAPGSAQVRRGIPAEVLKQIHFLSCNRGEALGLAHHLEGNSTNWTLPGLLHLFYDHGVQEVRISDGENGVYALSKDSPSRGSPVWCRAFQREDPCVSRFLPELRQAGVITRRTELQPDTNGCGDSRLGVELALALTGMSLRAQLVASNLVASLQTYNPRPHIGNFPDDFLRRVLASLPSSL